MRRTLLGLIGGAGALSLTVVGAVVNPAVAASPPNPPSGAIIVNNQSVSGSTVPGCGDTDVAAFPSIQAAVTAAPNNSTIYVCAGTYNESVSISKPLTLDGAEYGVDARGRTGQPETVVTGTGGVVYNSGATTGTLSGFSLGGSTDGRGEVIASNAGSGWTFTDNIVDVSNGGYYMNTNGEKNPPTSTVADNQFVQAVPSTAGSGDSGQAVLLWANTARNVTISDNDFDNLSGPGAGINTTQAGNCGATVDTTTFGNNLLVSGNTFRDSGAPIGSGPDGYVDENFIAMFCMTNAQIVNNKVTITDPNDANAASPIYLGGGDWSSSVKGNTLTGNGASSASGVVHNSDFYPSGTDVAITGNTISGFLYGIHIRQGAYGTPAPASNVPSYFSIGNNRVTNSTYGIAVSQGLYGTVYNNNVTNSTTEDCEDDTTGGNGTAGTDNTWTGNVGALASPSTICNPAPSTVLYRVNAGGSQVSGSPNWTTDTTGSPSKYNNAKSSGNNHTYSTTAAINTSQAGGAPATIFKTHRYVVPGQSDLIWNFPVQAGKEVTVNLYFAEIWAPCFHEGCRTFDVSIDGQQVLDNFDIYAAAGDHGNWGIVRSFNLQSPKTGTVTISFDREVQNPMVSGVEIITN